MTGALFNCCRQRQQAVFINVGGGDNVGDLRLADGQSTGFIERHLAHLAQLFQCRAAFNQRPAPCGDRQAGGNRRRGRNDQRARAADQQQR